MIPHPAGISNSYIVLSTTGPGVHVVDLSNRQSCDCKHFELNNVCAYLLAAAMTTQDLVAVLTRIPQESLRDLVEKPALSGLKPGKNLFFVAN